MDNEVKNKPKINLTGVDIREMFVPTKVHTTNPLTINAIDLTTTVQSKNYLTAIDYISTQSGKLNAVTNQINFLTSPAYQQSILTAVAGVQSHLSAFSTIQSYLPKVDHLGAVSPMMDLSRQATLAISGMTSPSIITGLATSVAKNYQPWYEANIAKSSILWAVSV